MGEGGTSVVYLAIDIVLNKQWAIKVIDKNSVAFTKGEDWRAEINLLKMLDYAYILRVVDFFEDERYAYVVEDVIDGKSFEEVIATNNGPFDQNVVLNWGKQIANILIYLHSMGIVYRDLKPQNLVLTARGNLTLLDFGAARFYKQGKINDTVNLGTQGYAAPEQYRRDRQTDNRTDIYNFGALMFQLLTGENPADPKVKLRNVRDVNRKVSRNVSDIVQKCLQNDPNDRYQFTVDLLYDLEHANVDHVQEIKRATKTVIVTVLLFIFSIVSLGVGITAKNLANQKNNEIYWSYINTDLSNDFQTLYSAYWNASYINVNSEMLPIYMLLKLLKDRDVYSDTIVNDILNSFNKIPDSVKDQDPAMKARIYYGLAFFYTVRLVNSAYAISSEAPKNYDYAFQYYSFAVNEFEKAGMSSRSPDECLTNKISNDLSYPLSYNNDWNMYCISMASRLIEDYRHTVLGFDIEDDSTQEEALEAQAKKDIRVEHNEFLTDDVIKAARIYVDSFTDDPSNDSEFYDIFVADWGVLSTVEEIPSDNKNVGKFFNHLLVIFDKLSSKLQSETNPSGIQIDSKNQTEHMEFYSQELRKYYDPIAYQEEEANYRG